MGSSLRGFGRYSWSSWLRLLALLVEEDVLSWFWYLVV